MANARENFENAVLAERVARRSDNNARRAAHGTSEMPQHEWAEAVKLFPLAIQREFTKPRILRNRSILDSSDAFEVDIALSDISGVRLEMSNFDPSEGWPEGKLSVDWELWIGKDDWTGGNEEDLHTLKRHVQEFERALEELDPVGYVKFTGKR